MTELKLEVGKTYNKRGGGTVKIIKNDESAIPLLTADGCWYCTNGRYAGFSGISRLSDSDLISEYIEPAQPAACERGSGDAMTDTIHSCGYHCQLPGCIKAQRDELVAKYVAQPVDGERFAIICDGVAAEHGGVAEGPFVTNFGKHTQQSMAAGAMNCAAAIRNIAQPVQPAPNLKLDGDQWCATWPDFINLQESDAGFGDTPELAISALREAIVQPVQPCMGCNGHGEVGGLRSDGYDSEICPYCKGGGTEQIAQPAQPTPRIVNYREIADCVISNLDGRKGILFLDVDAETEEEIRQEVADTIENMANTTQPAPVAQAEPLSDERLDLMCEQALVLRISKQQFARAIEAAHGIGKA